ncbi:MAG: O-antigen ligase family protein [Cyanobacteria bacterium P01_H01_bin.119]
MMQFLKPERSVSGLILVSLICLPYSIYLGLAGLVIFMGLMLYRYGSDFGQLLWQQGFVLLGAAMALNVIWASFHGEALLQLTNFLPYFGLFAACSIFLRRAAAPVEVLERWAIGLVLATIPINLWAGVEYWLRSPAMMARLIERDRWRNFYQLYYGHRAYAVFHHPNVMACFLVMVFGVALGVVLYRLNRAGGQAGDQSVDKARNALARPQRVQPVQREVLEWLGLIAAMGLILAGVFFTGSRNGILILGIQLLCFGWIARRHRLIAIAGLISLTTLAISVWGLGIGGRAISLGIFTDDPRVLVWQFAGRYIQQRPLQGWGLGSYKLMYVPGSIPGYENINHAHNFWVTLAAEAGLPTAILFTVIIGRLCYEAVRFHIQQPSIVQDQYSQDQYIFVGYGLAFLGVCLFSLFDVPLFDARINVMGWLSLAGFAAVGTFKPTSSY